MQRHEQLRAQGREGASARGRGGGGVGQRGGRCGSLAAVDLPPLFHRRRRRRRRLFPVAAAAAAAAVPQPREAQLDDVRVHLARVADHEGELAQAGARRARAPAVGGDWQRAASGLRGRGREGGATTTSRGRRRRRQRGRDGDRGGRAPGAAPANPTRRCSPRLGVRGPPDTRRRRSPAATAERAGRGAPRHKGPHVEPGQRRRALARIRGQQRRRARLQQRAVALPRLPAHGQRQGREHVPAAAVGRGRLQLPQKGRGHAGQRGHGGDGHRAELGDGEEGEGAREQGLEQRLGRGGAALAGLILLGGGRAGGGGACSSRAGHGACLAAAVRRGPSCRAGRRPRSSARADPTAPLPRGRRGLAPRGLRLQEHGGRGLGAGADGRWATGGGCSAAAAAANGRGPALGRGGRGRLTPRRRSAEGRDPLEHLLRGARQHVLVRLQARHAAALEQAKGRGAERGRGRGALGRRGGCCCCCCCC